MNPGSRDTPTEEKAQRLASGDGHGHSKTAGSMVMHDHGRHSPASAHSPGVSGKLPGLHPDGSRASRGFGMPSFSTTGLPGFSLDHLPLLFNSASSLIFPPFLHPHPSTGPLFPGVLPPILPPPPPPITSLFPSPGAECEVSNSGWSAHSAGSRNTSSLGSSSSDGDVAAKVDGRTVRSSRCSPDINLTPSSLSSGIRKIWETTVADPVCISDAADMPLSLVTRRETTSRGSSVAESVVCTGDSVSVARAASTETSRTPSLDGESTCHLVGENSIIQEQTVPVVSADQPVNWPTTKTTTDTSQAADDGKSSAGDDVWSSNSAASRSSGIVLPPRKRLTRNAEELQSSTTDQSSTAAANSPSPATNFRSCWKKFSAKSNVSVPSSHRTFGGKPQYDCRTYFHKLAETAKAAAANKAFVAGKGKGHFYRNANKTSPRSSDQNTGSPRVTRSQSKPKKTQSPKSSPAEPAAPVRKSTRKKSFNSRFEEYDRTGGKNKKLKSSSSDSNAAGSDAGKENSRTAGDEAVSTAEKKPGKNRRRGKQSSKDGDSSTGIATDAEDSTSHLSNDASQPATETDSKLNSIENSSVATTTATSEGSGTSAKLEGMSLDLEPSVVITVLPPKFRHFKNKAAASTIVLDSLQGQTNSSDKSTANESTNSEIAVPVKADGVDSVGATAPSEVTTVEGDGEFKAKPSLPPSTETSSSAEVSVSLSSEEAKASHAHSVGGRKSLLYRSSAMTDSQPSAAAETKPASTGGENESCASVTAVVTRVSSAGSVSADETSDIRPCLSEISVSEQKVSSELCDELSVSCTTATESTSVEVTEKVQSDNRDGRVDHIAEELSDQSHDVISSKSASPGIVTEKVSKNVPADVSNTSSSDYPSVPAAEKSDELVESTSNDSTSAVTWRLSNSSEVPADSLNECDNESNLPPKEVTDVSAISVSRSDVSVSLDSSDIVAETNANSSTESSLCMTHDSTVGVAYSLSCRTKPVETCSSTAVEATVQTNESLKRLMPDDLPLRTDDKAKRRRTDSASVENSTDVISLDVTQSVDNTPNPNTAVSLLSSSGECDSRTTTEQTLQPPVVTTIKASSATSARNKAKPEKSKRIKTKANQRVKPNRTSRKAQAESRSVIEEKSDPSSTNFSEAVETAGASEPPVVDKTLTGLADSNHKTPDVNTSAIIKYAVSNSADRVCDTNANTSSAQPSTEHKSLRISLVAVTEPNGSSSLRLKDPSTEDMYSAVKFSSGSPATAVCPTTTASGTNSLKQFMPGSASPDAELPVAPAGVVLSQESVSLENDSSALLSQCKSLSVVIEKMRNSNREPPPETPVAKPTVKRRKRGVKERKECSDGPPAVTEAPSDKPLYIDESPATESLMTVAPSVADEYSFTEDTLSVSLPMQRVSRTERKTSSRKSRSSLPTRNNKAEMSPAAVSDTSSRGATSSLDLSAQPDNTGPASVILDSSQKQPPNKPDSGTARSIRKKQNSEDKEARSSSPFTQNGNLLAPVVEASLDGHKLKLRITKYPNRLIGDSAGEAKVSVPPPSPPSSSYEFAEDVAKSSEDEVVQAAETEPAPVEVAKEHRSPRRRQLKVEGVRSRFLTLHKPAGLVPSADHVKCRLVKVGRRHWMSIGGEEAEDDTSSRHSDTETPAGSSPASSSIDDMVQQPTRDRLLLVSEVKPQRRRGRPPKIKTDSGDTKPAVPSSKRTKKRVKPDLSRSEIRPVSPKPELRPKVISRPVREDVVPWLDCDDNSPETQPYCALDSSSSLTIAGDIDQYRQRLSTPTEFMTDVNLAVSDVLSDYGVTFECNAVRTPSSMFFVPSELERLMEALVLDDIRRQSRLHSPPTTSDPGTRRLSSASIHGPFSYYNSVPVRISSPRNSSEMDLLLSQPSLRLRNCTLPVDPSDSSDYDCTFVGYEYPVHSLPDPVELPPLMDRQYIDEDFSLADPHVYSCVDFYSSPT